MADSSTPNYSFVLPEVGASRNTWGTKLNQNWTDIDLDLKDLEDTKADLASPTFTGTVTIPTLSVTGNLTIGDASGDSITCNASTMSIPNGLTTSGGRLSLNFTDAGSGVLYVDEDSAGSSTAPIGILLRRDGVSNGDASPSIFFDVGGGGGNAQIYSTRLAAVGGRLVFATENTAGTMVNRIRLDEIGAFRATTNGTFYTSTASHELTSDINDFGTLISNRNTGSSAIGLRVDLGITGSPTGKIFSGITGAGERIFIEADGDVRNSNNSYGAISDIKIKENIKDASPKLKDLLKVRFVSFNIIGDTKKQFGVIAQELEQIFPGLVHEKPDTKQIEEKDKNGNVIVTTIDLGTTTKSVNYSTLALFACKGLQEQQQEIEALKSRLDLLEGK